MGTTTLEQVRTTLEQARTARGWSLEKAAKRLRVTSKYLRSVELGAGAPYALAERAAPLYGVSLLAFRPMRKPPRH
ncbi:helix-turn-helix domain-containing protein [Armatimonas sp.]|uniref:helix-turn-helix domain-containing protein n=1 Tax=Armatimonas sp. TaxID=1872638 RepID=UPI00374D3FC2